MGKEGVMGFALSNMQLTSPAFKQGGRIPAKYTGEGENVSPALSWSGAPALNMGCDNYWNEKLR